jgi:hypothetical protein
MTTERGPPGRRGQPVRKATNGGEEYGAEHHDHRGARRGLRRRRSVSVGVEGRQPLLAACNRGHAGETEPELCGPHMVLYNRGHEADAWLVALEAPRGFLASEVVQTDELGLFRELVYDFNVTLTERAAEAAVKDRAAEILANQGPENRGPEDPILREVGAYLLTRADAMTVALAILGRGDEPKEEERLVAYATVKYANKFITKEWENFRAKHISE